VRHIEQRHHALIKDDASSYRAHEKKSSPFHASSGETGEETPQQNEERIAVTSGAATDSSADLNQQDASVQNSCAVQEASVLALYTPNAAQGRDIEDIITLAVSETNQAYTSSLVNNIDLSIAHAQELNFNESFNPENDLEDLISDFNVQQLRDTHDADLVVLVTDGQYGGTLGIAGTITLESNRAYAIVQADAATGGAYTFAHEVGHLQAGQHHPDDPTGTGAYNYAFGHRFSYRPTSWLPFRREASTIMAYTLAGSYPNFLDFSNPDRSYKGASLGTSSRDNAQAFRSSASTVATFNSSQALQTTIASYADPGTTNYTFTANPCGASGSYNYEWRLGTDPLNPGPVVSTNKSFSTVLQEGQTHYATVEVSSSGQTVSASRSVYVPPTDCGNQVICELQNTIAQNDGTLQNTSTSQQASSELAVEDPLPEEVALQSNYPNPFGESTTVVFDTPQSTDATLTLFDITGRRVATIAEDTYRPGRHSVTLDATSLTSGTYIVRLDAEEHSDTMTITVVK
jgi:hypothetical protein